MRAVGRATLSRRPIAAAPAVHAGARRYSPLVGIGLALVLPPAIAAATKGKYYLRRTDDGIGLPMYDDLGNPSDAVLTWRACRQDDEWPDVAACETHDAYVCSLSLSTDRVGGHVLPEQRVERVTRIELA